MRQTFVEGEGGDYLNQSMPWGGGDAVKTNRWLVTDNKDPEQFFVVYAYDSNNDGVVEELQLREAHPLTGQRGFGFLMTGTLTTLQPNTDLRVQVKDAAIVRGTINLMGDGSDLFVQSDTFTYWEGEATVPGTITLLGGVAPNGTNLLGDNGRGTSLYVHAASQLYAAGGTGSVVLQGGEDVEIHGRVVAGGYNTTNQGLVWTVDDASVNVTAGQRILVDSAITATGHIRLETTSAPSADDDGWGVVVTTAGGLSALGRTTAGGSTIEVDAVGGITFMGQATSGGVIVPASASQPTETVTWAENDSTLTLRSAGQVYLGGLALARDGTKAERGGTFRASSLITVDSGVAADGSGVKLPGTGRLTTSQEDGRIVIDALGNADLFGLIVAGGEIVDYEDATGGFLGSKASYFDGDSEIVVHAQRQVNLGKGLVAGKLVEVRGGTGTQAATVAKPWLDDGVVLGGDTRLKTLRENSQVKLSASGDVTVMLPAWKEEILADGFAQLATGKFTGGDVKFAVSINLGSGFTTATVTVAASSLSDNDDLLDLAADVQSALDAALGTNSTQLLVQVSEGRLHLVSPAYKFTIASVAGGGAERLGLTQIADANPTAGSRASERLATVDASQRGSKVVIGNPTLEAGSVTMSGYIRAYESITFNTLPRASGAQDVKLTSSSRLETLSGGMLLSPAGHTVLEGELVALGRYADIVINAKQTVEIKGRLEAQRDIIVNAGTASTVSSTETSLATLGTSELITRDAGGRIVLTGLNNVLIDSIIGKGNPGLGRLDITSTNGTLTIAQRGGWLETGALMTLQGQDVVIEGVVRSSLATPATYDEEVTITATRDVTLGGDFSLAGSMIVDAGRDISATTVTLKAAAARQHLTLSAQRDITLGTADGSGGVVLEADQALTVSAGRDLTVGVDAVFYSQADDSRVVLQGEEVLVLGTVYAGAESPNGLLDAGEDRDNDQTLDAGEDVLRWTGLRAAIEVQAGAGFFMGSANAGADLWATGPISVNAGPDNRGIGIQTSATSSIRSDARARFDGASGVWPEAQAGADGSITLNSDGDVWLGGAILAQDTGSDIAVKSRARVVVDALVSADDKLDIIAGTHQSGVAVLVETLVLNGSTRVSGGTLDTAAGGSITVAATDSIYIKGVVGQQDLGGAKVGLLKLESTGRDVLVYRNIDVRDDVQIFGGEIRVLAGSYVYATGVDSKVFLRARDSLEVSGSNAPSGAAGNDALILADKLVHLLAPVADVNGIVEAGVPNKGAGNDGRVLVNVSESLTMASGFVTSNGTIHLNAGVDMAWTRARLEATILKQEMIGGTITIGGTSRLSAPSGDIVIQAGSDVTLDADAVVPGSRSVSVERYNTVAETITTVVGYEQVAPGPSRCPWSPGRRPRSPRSSSTRSSRSAPSTRRWTWCSRRSATTTRTRWPSGASSRS